MMLLNGFRPVCKGAGRLVLAGSSASSVELKDIPNEPELQENSFIRKRSGGALQADSSFIRKSSGTNLSTENSFLKKTSGSSLQVDGGSFMGHQASSSNQYVHHMFPSYAACWQQVPQPHQQEHWHQTSSSSNSTSFPGATSTGVPATMAFTPNGAMYFPVLLPMQGVFFAPKAYAFAPPAQNFASGIEGQARQQGASDELSATVGRESMGVSMTNQEYTGQKSEIVHRPLQSGASDVASTNSTSLEGAPANAQLLPVVGPTRTGASRRLRRRRRGFLAAPEATLPKDVEEIRRPVDSNRRIHGETVVPRSKSPMREKILKRCDSGTVTPSENMPLSSTLSLSSVGLGVGFSRCESPSQLWPATPMSTPAHSPRAVGQGMMDTGFSMDFVRFPNFPASEVQGDSIDTEMNAGAACDSEYLEAQLSSTEPAARQHVLDWVSKTAWMMASTPSGCRVVQKAVEVGDGQVRLAIAEKLRGRVQEAVASPHANHVLQKCIALMPPDQINFVITELVGSAQVFARHRYGCRVMERLIEHCPASQVEPLVEEVISGADKLCRHGYGNFVVQHILEHGSPSQQSRVTDILRADAVRLAKHRVASHVVKAALVHCHGEERAELARALAADMAELSELAHHHCGSFVVRELRRLGNGSNAGCPPREVSIE